MTAARHLARSPKHSDLHSSWLWNPKGLVLFSSSLSSFGRLTMLAVLGLGYWVEEGMGRHDLGLIRQPPGACSASERDICSWGLYGILWRSYENVGWSETFVGTSKSLGRGWDGPFSMIIRQSHPLFRPTRRASFTMTLLHSHGAGAFISNYAVRTSSAPTLAPGEFTPSTPFSLLDAVEPSLPYIKFCPAPRSPRESLGVSGTWFSFVLQACALQKTNWPLFH